MSTISGHVLFRNAHAYAKAGRPFTDMEWMCALDEKKGLDMGMSYRTDKKCCEFIQCIADKQQAILQASVQSETSFLSWWMVDLNTYCRQAVNGVVAVNFLAYVNIGRGTAQNISNAIIQALETNLHLTRQTIFTKLVGFGSDGASVMTGCKSGGGTLLKKEQPLLFTLHCMAHWLELGFKGITEANTFMATFTELLFFNLQFLPFQCIEQRQP
eukprot:Em0087g5a